MGKLVARRYRAPAQKSKARQVFLELGETERVARVLAALVDLGETTASKIGDYTGYTYATITRTLEELEGRGWISSQKLPTKARGRNPTAYALDASKTKLRRHYNHLLQERLAKLEAPRK